ncbi:MAG: hypothetical protein GTO54_09185, partial [Nitrososphaeria archaeon]|nr:hypothetical protein [Nitrososphaeria archaeon]
KEIAATTISKPDGSFIMFVLKDKLFHVIAHTSQETVSGATAAHVYTVTT